MTNLAKPIGVSLPALPEAPAAGGSPFDRVSALIEQARQARRHLCQRRADSDVLAHRPPH